MTEIVRRTDGALMEAVVVRGDLSGLAPEDRARYYTQVCESVGLNPLTRPFEYMRLNGKDILYAKRDATDQLRAIHGISIKITDRAHVEDVYVVTATATRQDGRCDESTGAVTVGGLKGDAMANALMKAETKAKRRVTLSICGLGWLDESELETIPAMSQRIVEAVAQEGAIAEEQAKRRMEAEALADEWIPLVEGYTTIRDLESFIYYQGSQIRTLHSNAKAKLWRRIQATCERLGMSPNDAKKLIKEAPEITDAEEVTDE